MATRTLTSAPRILPLYARAAAPLIPGASLLPFVPGGGGDAVPELELELPDVETDPAAVAAYARVCGFALRDTLPVTYPHVLAFPLQMAVMADGGFPFGAVGLVHVENRIVQHRPIGISERLALHVRPTGPEPHPRGRTFALLTAARIGRETVWESVTTVLRRGGGAGGERSRGGGDELPAIAEWNLGGDLGRRYAAVSGDRNPIHMHALTAKPLGFPRAIAHGMWTKARCLAALESRLPDAYAVDVAFRRPILLPGRVELCSGGEGAELGFAVRDADGGTRHLEGRVGPPDAEDKATTGRKNAS